MRQRILVDNPTRMYWALVHMIIDCHGHYTTAPAALQTFREQQIAGLKGGVDTPLSHTPRSATTRFADSLENAQLKLQRARGTDLTIFSPRASAMAHHIGNETTVAAGLKSARFDPSRGFAVSGQFHRRLSIAPIAGSGAGEQRRRARTLRHGAGIHRM